MPGLTDNTLDEIDSHLRVLRGRLSTLEAARRQLLGEPETESHVSSRNGDEENSRRLARGGI